MATKLAGLKDLRQNLNHYIAEVEKGESITIYRRSQPVFVIKPVEGEQWEEVIDFTKFKKGGVNIAELLKRL